MDFSDRVLDPNCCLDGVVVVEASAGTGKTYSIQNAYLRLILEQGLTVQQVLVVTFTEAATAELRGRLRRILRKCQLYLDGRLPENDEDYPRLQQLSALPPAGKTPGNDSADRQGRVRLALLDFDSAAIFTIHGFCHRVLQHYAFECGYDPDPKLLEDPGPVVEAVCQDWWRKATYPRADFPEPVPFRDSTELRQCLQEYLKQPEADLEPNTSETLSWGDAAERISSGRVLLERMASADDKAAKEIGGELLAELAQSLADTPGDAVAVRDVLENIGRRLPKATWSQGPAVPECIRKLIGACRAAHEQMGQLQGNLAWCPGNMIRRAKHPPVDYGPVANALHDHAEEIRAWLDHPGYRWMDNQAARNRVAAFRALLDMPDAWPEAGDAKGFCKEVKAVAEATPDALFQRKRLGLAEAAPELAGQIDALRRAILGRMAAILAELAAEARHRIRQDGFVTYDEMLRRVRDALGNDAVGGRLREVLAGEYRAALIDEFQDTDPVQYEILSDLFGQTGAPLLYVGDPKQAIYRFRGADVFTYYRAKAAVPDDRLDTLGTNYRSEENLVRAVNELFRDDGGGRTFRHASIPYDGTLRANDLPDPEALQQDGARDPAPLKLWRYTGEGRLPGASSPEARHVYADVADEVVSLLSDPALRIGGTGIRPGAIAVLVLTHEEAEAIHRELEARGVCAVRQNVGNVFDGDEAPAFALLLRAMLRPGDASAVRGALCTGLLPCTRDDVYRYARDDLAAAPGAVPGTAVVPASLEAWMEVLREAGECWRRRSFIEAFRHLMERVDLRAHLIDGENGLRRLVNVLHQAELTHQAAEQLRLDPPALLRWFTRQLDPETRQATDEQSTRLVSDEDAVRIMTVYKSKGLEFPIVFAPTLWRRQASGVKRNSAFVAFHSPGNNRLVLSLDRTKEANRERAKEEDLQENLRLVYVAATRAASRAYLVDIGRGDPGQYALRQILEKWERREAAGGQSAIAVIGKGGPEVGGSAPPRRLPATAGLAAEELRTRGEREGPPRVDKTRGHTSFSGLSPHQHEAIRVELRDLDEPDEAAQDEEALGRPAADIFSIPGGARTGDCWHTIFERLDFQAGPDERARITGAELDRYGICRGTTPEIANGRRESVLEMVGRVLDVPLAMAGAETFRFRDIPVNARRSEMAFHFSLRQVGGARRTGAIREVLARHWAGLDAKQGFLERLDAWDRAIPQGFLTGFIDLVFCHRDRFYIVDWKSNRRRGRPEDFHDEGLADEMTRHAYFLQYLIYAVAVHGFLARRLNGYDFERHFGGVFYVFLRGVATIPGGGVYADRPSRELITDLAGALTGEAP